MKDERSVEDRLDALESRVTEAETANTNMLPISDALDALLTILDQVIEGAGVEETDEIVEAFQDVRRCSNLIR